MKTRRWMTSVLAESQKDQIELPWARSVRAKRRAGLSDTLKKAS